MIVKISETKRKIIPILLLILVVLIFLGKGVLMGGVFFGADEMASDLLHFSYPYREFWANDYLRNGQIPLWNSYLASGFPFLAEAQTGVFYLPGILLFFFLPFPVALNYLVIFCFLAVALGTYFYGRTLGFSSWAAFFAGVVFALSGYMVGHLRHIPMITAMAPLPWLFLVAEKVLVSDKLWWALVLAGLVSLSFFAGHLTTTYAILLFLGIYFIVRLGERFKAEGKESFKPIIIIVWGLILGASLAAVQLAPSLELIPRSTRLAVGELTGAGFDPKYWLMFIKPYIFGDPSLGTWDIIRENFWENIGYLGIVPLVMAILGIVLWLKRRIPTSAIGVCLVLGLLLTAGPASPVYRFFWDWVPGFSATRIPGRLLLFVDFFLAIFAGFSLDWLMKKFGQVRKNFLLTGVILVSLIDLFYFGYHFNSVMPQNYFEKPESVRFIKNDRDLFRISSMGFADSWNKAWQEAHGWDKDLASYINQREVLPPDFNLLFRLSSPSLIYELGGHFVVKRSAELDTVVLESYLGEKESFAKLLGMENVKYLITATKLEDVDGLVLAKEIKGPNSNFNTYLYLNKKVMPRAYLVGKYSVVSGDALILGKMLLKDFEPAKEVVLEKEVNYPQTDGRGNVKILKYEDKKVEIKTDVQDDKGAFLILSDTYYPGWQVTVDGQKKEILQANYNYRAVRLGPGEHRVVFTFEPLSVKIGAVISLVGLLILGLLATGSLINFWKKNK